MLGRLLLGFFAIAMFAATPAKASLVNIDPGDVFSLLAGDVYYSGVEFKAPGTVFSDLYTVNVAELSSPADGLQPVSFDLSVINVTPGPSQFGIADLTLSVAEIGGSVLATVAMSDAAGLPNPGFLAGLVQTLNIAVPVSLAVTVSGTALTGGGAYNLAISAIPLPATLPLLIGGVGLLAASGYRRRKAA